ncbi:hypothetical protein [Spirilliplanes yamanashiensis]|uniref:Uncharacterized protein n=1 Tax=Spirilliplanes yamanashiensis TaxID=42233 RepID=A0A8J3YD41_9ACTN|nr:hypothetical protein [Spirilliplanes yamanashiensis]MDP9818351.1 hypothetical protein [Spirilliplanes yamanashiensis]GIJ06571.1 hypothetical protein Sya03_59230 [Spirilliplanes yamanashiensis]
MTASTTTMDETMTDEHRDGEYRFSNVLEPEHEHATPEMYPRLGKIARHVGHCKWRTLTCIGSRSVSPSPGSRRPAWLY